MKKSILIISYGYPPLNDAGAQRPFAIAKYLNKEKFNVTVITCENPTSAIGLNKDFNSDLQNVNVIKIKSYVGGAILSDKSEKAKKRGLINFIKRFVINFGQQFIFPDKGLFWYPNVISYLKRNFAIINNTDYVFSTSPGLTNHRVARFIIKNNHKISWIADFRDFNFVENWEYKKGLKSRLHKRLEALLISEASKLIFVTNTMKMAYQKHYPKEQHKMNCVYNGFDKNEFPSVIGTKLDTDKIVFFYAGSFYAGIRSPKSLLQMLDRSIDEKILNPDCVQLDIAGPIEEESKLVLKSFRSYQCVNFLGSLPRTEVLQHMHKATFLWLIVGNIKSHYETVPIKLFEYIAARRPIVNFAPLISESSQIIRNNQLGYNFNTLDFDEDDSFIVFKELLANYRKGIYRDPLPAEKLFTFTWEKQVLLLENLILNE